MKEIYIASGWFNPKQADQLDRIKKLLDEMSITYFSPKDEALATSEDSQTRLKEVFDGNVNAIKQCQYLIANTQDKDMGTVFECGTAYMMGIPILYFAEGLTGPFNLMLAQSGFGVAKSIDELKELIKNFNLYGRAMSFEGMHEQAYSDLNNMNIEDIQLESAKFVRHFRLGTSFMVTAQKKGASYPTQYGPLSVHHPKTIEILLKLKIPFSDDFRTSAYKGPIE